ncbi:Short-chain dehydrogenase/reductase SDR protein [Dioscorea alata]|uniref:Short-chain dehydrogenase/reductase SDR protein n=1 Tax=Dioscorea alata TaxID=55571 RepID=A0ACB7UH75_DIOAL|nr:Short-chain dehydrogenase/reductase SDR protein [Dioscorea alata]
MTTNNITDKRWSLQGTTALVTGGCNGIGLGIVKELVSLGATVHVCDKNEPDLIKRLEQWEEQHLPITGSLCDVSSRDDRHKLIEKASSLFNGKLDILVNNAGVVLFKPTVSYTAEEFSFIMSTNFESAFHLSQLAHPLLKASGSGSIVFISSIAGLIGANNVSLYAASKAAMNQLVKNLACEWGKDNIRANGIAPALIRTPLLLQNYENKKISEIITHVPLGRAGEPQDVASLAVFLCLPSASYITGQIICVDGGRSINIS